MEQKTLNIYERLLAITSELSRVAKNLEVGFGANKYKATGEADVLAAIKPLEKQYGVYSFPIKREIVETMELETKTGTRNLFMRIATTYRFVNVEKPEEYVEITSYGDGVDSQDKAPGKAMTYSDKYALMKAYKIITGDDPDQNMSEELKGVNPKNKAQNSTYTAPKQKASVNVSAETKADTSGKMTGEQAAIILSMDDKLKDFLCKKFGLENVRQLTQEQAGMAINALREKGIIK